MQSSGISSRATRSASRSSAGPTHSRFALSGRSASIDPRIDAVRRDLADVRLAERVFAPHYAAPLTFWATMEAPIRADRAADGEILSEILSGDAFEVLELSAGLAWGVSIADGVVGYVAEAALSATPPPPGNGRLHATDIASAAETLIGTPAKPGGRSPAGVNCSGLVFLALQMTGATAPRFIDLQAAQLGAPVPAGGTLRRGDLVFFADHAAILVDADDAVHVPAGGGAVTREALDAIVASGAFGPVTNVRRLA